MKWPRRAEFGYGNTRLRSRRAELLADDQVRQLLTHGLDDLVAALDRTPYAADIAAAQAEETPARLRTAVRANLGRALEQMRSFYAGTARTLVDALLSGFDVSNVVAVLRLGARRDADAVTAVEPAAIAESLTPVGWLSEQRAREFLRAPTLAGVVDLLARAMPDSDQRVALRTAFTGYERTDDLAELERAVLLDHAARHVGILTAAGADPLLERARRDTDDRNLLVALRLRDATQAGAQDTPEVVDALLPGGSIEPRAFTDGVRESDPELAAAMLARLGGARWSGPLERWAVTGDLTALARRLDHAATAADMSLFGTGDALGIDIPIAFTAAKRAEARNVRLIIEGSVRGIATDVLRGELVLVGGQP